MTFTIEGEPAKIERCVLTMFNEEGYSVGYLKLEQPAPNTIYVFHLKVLNGFRGNGHSRPLLMEAVRRIALMPGIDKITINACPFEDDGAPLEALVRVYESAGFSTFSKSANGTTHNMVKYLRCVPKNNVASLMENSI
jgi:predicted GNAT family acetyltransferase